MTHRLQGTSDPPLLTRHPDAKMRPARVSKSSNVVLSCSGSPSTRRASSRCTLSTHVRRVRNAFFIPKLLGVGCARYELQVARCAVVLLAQCDAMRCLRATVNMCRRLFSSNLLRPDMKDTTKVRSISDPLVKPIRRVTGCLGLIIPASGIDDRCINRQNLQGNAVFNASACNLCTGEQGNHQQSRRVLDFPRRPNWLKDSLMCEV